MSPHLPGTLNINYMLFPSLKASSHLNRFCLVQKTCWTKFITAAKDGSGEKYEYY